MYDKTVKIRISESNDRTWRQRGLDTLRSYRVRDYLLWKATLSKDIPGSQGRRIT